MTHHQARAELQGIASKFRNDATRMTGDLRARTLSNADLLDCVATDCPDEDAINVLAMLKREFAQELPS